MTDAIVKADAESAVQNWRRTTDIAGLVREAVLKMTVNIQGRRYLQVAGYQAIANAYGYVASPRDVEKMDGGWKCVAEVKRMSDGMVIATGIGVIGDDEKLWAGRPLFARIAMCQTRAAGRALRNAFAFVAPLIDAGIQTTPAEEMEGVVDAEVVAQPQPAPTGKKTAPTATAALKASLRAKGLVVDVLPDETEAEASARHQEPPPHGDEDNQAAVDTGTNDEAKVPWGKKSGTPLSQLTVKDLGWYEARAVESIADPTKAKWVPRETQWLSAIQSELRRRGVTQLSPK